MARIALYVGAAAYIFLGAALAIVFSLEVDIFIGSARYAPMNVLATAVLFFLIAGFLLIASRDIPRNV